MSSTYSTSLRLTLQATGDNPGTWGDVTNTNLGVLLEQAIAGVVTIGITGNKTLSQSNGAYDESRSAAIIFTGTLTSTATITCPAVPKLYVIKNSTTGGYGLTITTGISGGSTVSVANGAALSVICDGTNIYPASATDSAYINFLPSGTGAVSTTVQAKERERISVQDFGADNTGVLDATNAFSLCAQAGTAISNLDNNYTLPTAPTCVRYIPAGTYKLTSLVSTNNRHVIWIAQGEVKVKDASGNSAVQYLNGKMVKEGQMLGNDHFGIRDYANTLSIVANKSNYMRDAQVDGFTSESDLNTYYSRDSVALFTSTESPATLLTTTSAAYTATTVTITAPSATVLAKLRVGMLIDTQHSPKYSAILKSWNSDGSVLTVNGWYQSPAQTGNTGAKTPTGTAGIYINPITKIWGQNTVVKLNQDSTDTTTHYAKQAAGYELNLINYMSESTTTAYDVWGFDASNKDGYYCDIAFQARKNFFYGFAYNSSDTDGLCGAGNFVVGSKYVIQALASTNFNTIGAGITITVSIANPAVITAPSGTVFSNGTQIQLSTTGALPTGLTSDTVYYVVGASGNTCNLSVTSGGTAITTTGTQSGVHTLVHVGMLFTATGTGAIGIGTARQVYAPNELNPGSHYIIATTGATGFTAIGAANNNQGTAFTYTIGASITGVSGYCYSSSQVTSAYNFTGDGNLLTGKDGQGNLFYQVLANGSVLLGNQNLALPAYIDFHSSGNAKYDARIISTGGNSTIAQGTLNLYGNSIVLAGASDSGVIDNTNIKLLTSEVFTDGTIHPITNNTINLGTSALRWANIYSVTALNVSSDATLKQDISTLSDAEKRVATRLKSLIKKYRFKSEVASKGDLARIHIGVLAQEVQAAFTLEGLDGFRYGLLCYDEWPATNGQPAGNTYSIRYEELITFILSAL